MPRVGHKSVLAVKILQKNLIAAEDEDCDSAKAGECKECTKAG